MPHDGVEHFYLTNHLSKDDYIAVLKPYIDRGLVTLRHEKRESIEKGCDSFKVEAYSLAVLELKNKAEWLLVCDTDEFAMPCEKKDLPSVLRDHDDYASVFFP